MPCTAPRVIEVCLRSKLEGFCGVVNVETIGDHPIDVHFRPSLEFFPLYGKPLIDCMLRVMSRREPGERPDAIGGKILVIPRDSRRIRVRDTDEASWRDELVYLRRS